VPPSTKDADYAKRLKGIESRAWRKWIDVQKPYRWNIRRLDLGFTLDVGAGIGRNLLHLNANGVGVDHNEESVNTMRERGLRAYRPAEFLKSEWAAPEKFDSLLLAHVLEHLDGTIPLELIDEYLPYVKKGGKVVVITPQEAGFRSDVTHVQFVDSARSATWLRECGLIVDKSYSFPFPRWVGRFFPHNEFVVTARK